MDLLDRYRGAMVGLAVGDALGAPAEFKLPGSFARIESMQGGGLFGLAPGQWTDDTAMALCLADSLLSVGGFDPIDQLTRYVRWYREGYLTCTGECFDIGMVVQAALLRFEAIVDVAGGSFKRKNPPLIQGSGYAVRSLEAALWAFHRSNDFREGALAAINLGDDADTTGAVFGQLAGAYYGLQGIPLEWRLPLAQRDLIKQMALGLYELALSPAMTDPDTDEAAATA